MPVILQLSDTHLFADPDRLMFGVNTGCSLERVIAHARRAHGDAVDVVLATGDLVHDESPAGYRRLYDMLNRFEAPVRCLPGNHDDPDLMRRILNGPRVTCEKSMVCGSWMIVLLDTRLAGSDGGSLGAAELDFLARALTDAADRHVMIALHHPPVPIDSPWMDAIGLANAADLFDVIDRYAQVRALTFGHIHQEFDRVRRGVRMLGAPSTCAQFKPRTDVHVDDPSPPGYRWFTLFDDGRFDTGVTRVASGA